MKKKVQKLYCYVDETGQDTIGRLFLVAIVLKEIEHLEILEDKLLKIEMVSGKKQAKWKKLSKVIKRKYFEELLKIKELKSSIFYSIYKDTKEYSSLTSLSIAKAVLAKSSTDYNVTVIIDGLKDKERDAVRVELKKLKIKYNKIRGMKDEQSAFLRLADAMAGFLREVYEEKEFALNFMSKFKEVRFVIET
jgi:hypothetical protein